ncbi:deoxyribonuclease-2-beta isoform X2 [Heptranchias perlo]|uniref:deoxyribonuclease-2-beta isoform X2 n=1 Tax=Heptranchias perlo TaxID=212740 RepID=UPI003559ED1C
MKTGSIRLLFFLLIIHLSPSGAEISCRDEAGRPVDWFVMYKLPKYQIHQAVGMGLNYMYLDPSTDDWQRSKHLVNTTESAVGRTLQQLYSTYKSKVNDRAYFIYNDAAPSMPYDMYHGHTKGKQLLYYNPRVYNWSLPDIFLPELSHLQFVAKGGSVSKSPWKRLTELTSTGGVQFQSFAKYKHFEDDIYAGWVAQTLKTDLLAETWNGSKHQLPSNCSLPKHVYNIVRIKLPGPVLFYSSNDHSKWCVSLGHDEGWTCIGDLNRTFGQMGRSAGLLCTRHPAIHRAFRRSVSWYENCTGTQ